MAYTNNPYCTVDDVSAALGLNAAQKTAQTPLITSFIPDAQAEIDQIIGHSYQTEGTHASPANRVFDGTDSERLFVGECMEIDQVLETTSATMFLTTGQIAQTITIGTTDITADCVLGPNNRTPGLFIKRLSGLNFLPGVQNYVVKGVWGNATIPNDIHRACLRLVIHWMKMKDTAYADNISEQGNVRQHYKKSMPDDVMEILTQHRRSFFMARSR